MKKFSFLTAFMVLSLSAYCQLQSGPMLGYSDMREVLIWAQTVKPARVKVQYWEQGAPARKFSTEEVLTSAKTAHTAKLVADRLLPGKRYDYEVFIDGRKAPVSYPLTFQSQPLWQWRTDPPAFRFALGSCTYISEEQFDRPGRAYGEGYEIFDAIVRQKPDFMLWTGDNMYLREPDWNSRSGVLHRYTHTRSVKQMQPLLGSVHHYATWDDHDFGPNDSDRSYWLKPVTLEAFKLFWGNPNYIFDEGCTGTFFWNDCQFFLMDDRTWRSPNEARTGDREYLGKRQLNWLIDALTGSSAPFKFVVIGGQVVNPSAIFENYANYADERNQLIRSITEARIPGVLFITGDRHHTILHRMERPGTYPLYDVTISPLTSGPAKPQEAELKQPTVVDGTLVTERNFATMEVSGPAKDRVLKIRVFDTKGGEKWNREIRAAELK
ncbi:alkaline phosphatase D family protein [Larkinella soli]|uniref:alkaline phosphatase D family protein n=1 Tax=Larkinella soli TaxID=1770527 RepID=UPI000FFB5044|nr:alkaline phosphatase D family protein [Larkinella soli]